MVLCDLSKLREKAWVEEKRGSTGVLWFKWPSLFMQSGSAASLHRYKAQTEKTHRQEHRNRLKDYSSVFVTMTLFTKKICLLFSKTCCIIPDIHCFLLISLASCVLSITMNMTSAYIAYCLTKYLLWSGNTGTAIKSDKARNTRGYDNETGCKQLRL